MFLCVLQSLLRLLFRGHLLARSPAVVRGTFLLSAVGATCNTTCKGAPRWAPCSERVVRCFSAGLFAGRCSLASSKLWQFLLRAALWVPFGAPHFATFEGVPRWAS